MNKREFRIVILSAVFALVFLGTLFGVTGSVLSQDTGIPGDGPAPVAENSSDAGGAMEYAHLPVVILTGGGTLPCVPTLQIPVEGAVMDNGRTDGLDTIIWDFGWSDCPSATHYHLYVKHPGAIAPVINDDTLTASAYHDDSPGTISALNGWEWKVRAKTGGVWSAWSPVRTFNVEPVDTDPPPSCTPALTTPLEGAVMDNGRTDTLDPIIWDFDWEDCPGATHYQLYVKRLGLGSPLIDIDTLTASDHHDESPGHISSLTGWYWKVRAKVGGSWGPWSPVRNFSVEPPNTDPPSACMPTLMLPAEGALMDNGRTDALDSKIWKFDWSDCPGATHYSLWVKHPAATVPTILKSDLTVSDHKSVTITYNPPAYESGWEWKVRAEIGGVWGPWSPVRTFDVEPVNTDPPSLCLPTLVTPVTGAVMDNGRTDGTEGIIWNFDWSDCTGASAYHIYVKRVGATNPMVDDETILTSNYIHLAPGNYIPIPFLGGWYWKVRAKKGGIWGPWTANRTFTVEPPDMDPAP